jgi:hypothetical protein
VPKKLVPIPIPLVKPDYKDVATLRKGFGIGFGVKLKNI